jgi:membrane-bound serine protease (ClpP class)
MKYILSLLFLTFSTHFLIFAQNNKTIVYTININQEINPTSRLFLSNGLKEAREMNAQAVLLQLNTYGGTVVDADSMRSAILYSPIPVYVFIDNNAASAGALISIACKKIYMRKGANIGAATVVNETGEAMPDKYQSYMRSTIRATAEAHGKDTIITKGDTIIKWKRDPRIAEAMVDDRVRIENVIDSGKVLTLTAEEAVKLGYCDGIAESVDEVITKYLDFPQYELQAYQPSLYDKVKGFLMNPFFQAILIMIIIAGIYFELQTPGVGFPSIAAITAAILYFAPLYIDGLAQNWEIVIFIIGLILIILEIFVVPGFGITGISGIILITTGLTLALLNNDVFSFKQVEVPNISRAIFTVLSGIILGFAILMYFSSRIGTGMFRKIALTTSLETSQTTDQNQVTLVGKQGKAMTPLRPSGKIIIENEVYDAIAENGFIERNENVTITKYENTQFYVAKEKQKG